MTRQLKRTTVAASVALAMALPASAFAIQGVLFDFDGAGGATSGEVVKTFDWGPGHVLYSNCFGLGGLGAASGCTIRAQGSISAIEKSVGGNLSLPSGVNFTFTLETKAISSAGGTYDGTTPGLGQSLIFSDAADVTSIFKIYANSATPNALAGTGYTAGSLILSGRVKVESFAIVNVGTAGVLLDQNGADDWAGLKTLTTSGTPTFTIDVLSKDDAYFKDPISVFSLTLEDANQTDNSASPFKQTDPSKIVAGKAFSAADVGSDGRDDIYCGAGKTTKCSAQFQGDASTTFLTNSAPEPGMLALLGIGLAGLGFVARRSRRDDLKA